MERRKVVISKIAERKISGKINEPVFEKEKMKDYKNIKTFDELIELEHGKIGTESRDSYEEGSQMFIISELLKDFEINSTI